ncbi:MAG: class I SAM-dependent methyltransferase [Bacteroidales bacterium]|jgi:SAM-dependent methyltransferase|nr:class I SAM-dependent methyltransferase [Bacteroidales bacterium]
MQERHTSRKAYFDEQVYTTEKYVIPFIAAVSPITKDTRVLEIGCGEGGNLVPFMDLGCEVTGIDMAANKIENAHIFLENHPQYHRLQLITDDIYNQNPEDKTYDIIFMRDVLEHIHDQQKFMHFVKGFLKDEGCLFLGFPPWQSPFGGHQQMCLNKYLSITPYYHLLPSGLYKMLLRWGGESEAKIVGLMEVRETGITIERFKRIFRKAGFIIEKQQLYFINPNYEIKFKLKPRLQSTIITSIPWVRNFFITTCYYLLKAKK